MAYDEAPTVHYPTTAVYDFSLKMSEKFMVLKKGELNDLVLNCAKAILQKQYSHLKGLECTLLLPTLPSYGSWIDNYIQSFLSKKSLYHRLYKRMHCWKCHGL
uniref:Uncharacterized protein n=1 Tax=Amphimedon queenslandica TaxID=400682 RepID=A0A1X7T4M0_AMPQE